MILALLLADSVVLREEAILESAGARAAEKSASVRAMSASERLRASSEEGVRRLNPRMREGEETF